MSGHKQRDLYRPTTGGPSSGDVLVYREEFLQRSETFIRDHLVEMPRYRVAALARTVLPNGLRVPGVPLHLTRARTTAGRAVQFAGYRAGADHTRLLDLATRSTLSALKPDLVHAHFGPDAALVARAAVSHGVPLVATFHGFDLTKTPEALRGRMTYEHYLEMGDALFGKLAGIITVSNFLRTKLLARGVDPSRIEVIACGVDTSTVRFVPPPVHGPVLFVGRLTAKKGVDDLIRAAASLPDPPDVVVIGDGPMRSSLEDLASSLRVRVDFRGAATSGEVRAAMANASLVAMPSKRAPSGDAEGLGVVALEAAATGRPVVGYRHGGLPEAVVDGSTGRLVSEGDVRGLAEALEATLSDPTDRARMGAAAREHVSNTFERAPLLARVADVYDRARRTSAATRSRGRASADDGRSASL